MHSKFCTHCGTLLPAEARFCFACGNPVPETAPTAPPASNPHTAKLIALAKTGPVTAADVGAAYDIAVELWETDPHSPDVGLLGYYALARGADQHFRQRWMAPAANRREKERLLREDLTCFFEAGGLKRLLLQYPNIAADQAEFLLYQLRGLREWLEDTLLGGLLFALRLEGAMPDKQELLLLSNIVGPARFEKIVTYVTFLSSRMK